MANPVTAVNPKVLRWARERAGYTAGDVALAVKKDVEVVESWESGASAPTYAQLEKLAYQLYKRPLALFFFPAPPEEREILSAREVYNELKGKGNKPHLDDWVDANKKVFLVPTPEETAFVGTIFAVPHFQQLVSEQQRLKGVPVAACRAMTPMVVPIHGG